MDDNISVMICKALMKEYKDPRYAYIGEFGIEIILLVPCEDRPIILFYKKYKTVLAVSNSPPFRYATVAYMTNYLKLQSFDI